MPMELHWRDWDEELKAARKKKGLTQQKLADLSHVSLKHIQNCERGRKEPIFRDFASTR